MFKSELHTSLLQNDDSGMRVQEIDLYRSILTDKLDEDSGKGCDNRRGLIFPRGLILHY